MFSSPDYPSPQAAEDEARQNSRRPERRGTRLQLPGIQQLLPDIDERFSRAFPPPAVLGAFPPPVVLGHPPRAGGDLPARSSHLPVEYVQERVETRGGYPPRSAGGGARECEEERLLRPARGPAARWPPQLQPSALTPPSHDSRQGGYEGQGSTFERASPSGVARGEPAPRSVTSPPPAPLYSTVAAALRSVQPPPPPPRPRLTSSPPPSTRSPSSPDRFQPGTPPAQERPHACGDCPRRFARRNDLLRHARKHTGERCVSPSHYISSARSRGSAGATAAFVRRRDEGALALPELTKPFG